MARFIWEVSPRTFLIVVRTGSRLSQIRFRKGRAQSMKAELAALHNAETLVAAEMPNISGGGIAFGRSFGRSLDRLIGYRGKHHTAAVDVDKRAAQHRLTLGTDL